MGDAADAKTIASYSRATNTATLASPVVIPPLANADDKAIKIKGYIYTRMTDFNGLSSQNQSTIGELVLPGIDRV